MPRGPGLLGCAGLLGDDAGSPAAELDAGAGVEPGPGDADAVDPGAVGGALVLDDVAVAVGEDAGVAGGGVGVGDVQVGEGAAAEAELAAGLERELAAGVEEGEAAGRGGGAEVDGGLAVAAEGRRVHARWSGARARPLQLQRNKFCQSVADELRLGVGIGGAAPTGAQGLDRGVGGRGGLAPHGVVAWTRGLEAGVAVDDGVAGPELVEVAQEVLGGALGVGTVKVPGVDRDHRGEDSRRDPAL
jgi:hypothetical protein